jgi:putative nucleotidyltransferase with HDIG domain
MTDRAGHTLETRLQTLPLSAENFPEIIPFQKEVLLYPLKTARSQTTGLIVISKKYEESSFTKGDIQLLGIVASQSSVSVHNAFLVEGLERNYVNTLMSLNAILEAKHPYTRGHTQRVTRYSTTVARELGLPSDEVKVMRDGAMLHDIGKIGISDAILNKPDSLDDTEFDIIKRHPIIGETIIKPIRFLERALPIIRHHHERMDGRGWPDGLAGVQIPLLVRICTLTDAYDAMTSRRPYRATMNDEEIRRELIRHCGTQFDEELVEVFLRLLDRGMMMPDERASEPVLMQI